MKKTFETLKNCLQPRPNIVVSSRKNGENNALAVAYAGNCSYDPPMVMIGIVPTRHSYDIIKSTGEFIVNVVPKDLKDEYYFLGKYSGRDVDKLAELDLNIEDGDIVDAPILKDFPINIECKVLNSIRTGSHEMFIGKVKKVHVDKKLVDKNNNVKLSDIDYL
ncbi:MAG: flavin reductase family protein [Fusobacteriota bacterium]